MNVDPAKWRQCLKEIKNISSTKLQFPENIDDEQPTKEVPQSKNLKVKEEMKYPELREE